MSINNFWQGWNAKKPETNNPERRTETSGRGPANDGTIEGGNANGKVEGGNNDGGNNPFGGFSWERKEEKKVDDQNQNGNQNSNQNGGGNGNGTQTQTPDIKALITNRIKSMEVTAGIDFKALAESGDPEALAGAFNGFAQNMYGGIMGDVNQMMKVELAKGIEAGVEKAVGESTGRMARTQLVEKMHEAIPFSNLPAIAPVANSVLDKALLDNNGDQKKALETVQNYFLAMKDVFEGGDGSRFTPDDHKENPGAQQHRQAKNEDWTSFLTEFR